MPQLLLRRSLKDHRVLPNLPTEIWLQITSYLSEEDIRELYFLNNVFYQQAMDIRYRKFVVSEGMSMSQLLCLSNMPSLAARVKNLDIDLRALAEHADVKTTWLDRLESALHLPSRGKPCGTVEDASSVFVEGLEFATAVRQCHLRVESEEVLRTTLANLRRLWNILHGRVETLALDVYSEGVDFVSQTLDDLSCIKHLSVNLRDEHSASKSWDAVSTSSLARLFNNASDNLEMLSLRSSFVTSIPWLRLSLNNLSPIPTLKRIHLDIPYDDITGTVASHFINSHPLIEELTLIPYFSIHSDLTPISSINLPNLRKLTLRLNLQPRQYFRFWGGLLNFAQLTHLSIYSSVHSKNRILIVCEAFMHSGIGNQLRYLTFDTPLIPYWLFDNIVPAFPQLHSLYIRAKYLAADNDGTTWDLDLFESHMTARQYPQWTLHDLTIIQYGDDASQSNRGSSFEAMEIASRSIPSVQSFCGWGTKDPSFAHKHVAWRI
ncbi:hypothetical protein ONZ45_g1785 [Pleurotus djamor]|nr:hypothetical protein ONZ45_g1785 [Pleurotus djamor]